MSDVDLEWQRKGATLSEKTAEKEFGLTREQIVKAVRAGRLRGREGSMHGNPWLRLLRREVEALVTTERGADHLKTQKAQAELTEINRQLKKVKAQAALLEKRRAELVAKLDPNAPAAGSATR